MTRRYTFGPLWRSTNCRDGSSDTARMLRYARPRSSRAPDSGSTYIHYEVRSIDCRA